MSDLPQVLQLDIAGNPQRWISYKDSAYYYSKGRVGWEAAPVNYVLRGGTSALTGMQSTLTINTIVAIKPAAGKVSSKQFNSMNRVPLTNKALFRRDQEMCAYCGDVFHTKHLSRDHVIPTSRGGKNVWTNVVTACSPCNKRKDNKTPEEFGHDLLYVPYVPNRAEWLILENRKILADQMEFLLARVPKESRLLYA